MTRKITVDIILFLYILLFVYAAVTKLLDYEKFTVQLGQSPMLTNYANVLAWSVPVSELVISILLILPATRLMALCVAFSFMIMFTTYIIVASNFSHYVPCSCGGVIEGMGWTTHLIFNVVFAVIGLAAILLYRETETVIAPHGHAKNISAP